MSTKLAAVTAAQANRPKPRRKLVQIGLFGDETVVGLEGEGEAPPGAASDEWYTPQWILDWLPAVDLDPCWCADSSVHATSTYDLRRGQDGLELPWHGNTWCNPPYSKCSLWVAKASQEGARGTIAAAILLIPASAGDAFWHELIWGQRACVGFLRGRVPFDTADGKGKGAGLGGSALVIFGPDRLAVQAHLASKSAKHRRKPFWVQVA